MQYDKLFHADTENPPNYVKVSLILEPVLSMTYIDVCRYMKLNSWASRKTQTFNS